MSKDHDKASHDHRTRGAIRSIIKRETNGLNGTPAFKPRGTPPA
ncbi:MAG: hypothetical protein WDN02_07635 [Methylovirgula sp.]